MNGYLQGIKDCLHGRRGNELAIMMALPISLQFSDAEVSLAHSAGSDKNLNRNVHKALQVDQLLSDVVGDRLNALSCLVNGNLDGAYRATHSSFNNIVDFMGNATDFPFLAGTLAHLASDLRIIASMNDNSKAERERLSAQCLRECQNSITRAFTLVSKDRLPLSDPSCKKLHIFNVTNTLFKIYFKLNTLQLATKLIKLVDTPAVLSALTAFPLQDVITYKFYVGRLAMFEDRLDEARECLQFALKYTKYTSNNLHNRKLILASLVPIEMLRGVMPTPLLGSQYGLDVYVELGNAVRTGDLRSYNTIFHKHKAVFIRTGTYLIIEQLKNLVYRNLFKRIYKITESTRLNLDVFYYVLQWLGEEMDIDEIECILANLIFQSRVKGYLSHQKRILVVGKTDPFPTSHIIKKQRNI